MTGRAWSPVPVPAGAPAAALVLARYEHRDPGDGLPAYATVLDEVGPVDPTPFVTDSRSSRPPSPSPSSRAGPPSSCTTSSGTSTKPPPGPSSATSPTCTVSWATAPSRRSNWSPRRGGAPAPAARRHARVRCSLRIDTAFDARADRRPDDAPALTHDGITTTYGALRERASGWPRTARRRGPPR